MRKSNAAKKQEYVPPASIAEELELIRTINGGLLDPAEVVEYAKNPDTLLHNKFEWDDSKAAYAHRLQQARMIIRLKLTVVDTKTEDPGNVFVKYLDGNDDKQEMTIRSFVSLTSDRYGEKNGYRTIQDVMADIELRGQLLADAKKDMIVFKRKYGLLNELAGVFAAMDKVA